MPFEMNWNYFSITGYISVLLWICVPLLWTAHMIRRPRRWLCHIALILAIAAFVFAKINSKMYVNRIQLDRSAEMTEWEAKQDAKRKAAEDSRSADVAQIRFAEDASGDFLDMAGMDDADRKYMEKIHEDTDPGWKKNKKTRSQAAADDDSIEALIGAKEVSEGIESDTAQQAIENAPVLMVSEDKEMASRLDGLNLKLVRVLILLSLIFIIIDYLRRANSYADAYMPLPVPSSWVNAMTPLSTVIVRPEKVRRPIPAELEWLIKRGDSFLYLTSNPASAASVPKSASRLPKGICPVDILHITDNDGISNDFVFEALWYGRSSFTVDSTTRSVKMLGRFMKLMRERKATRAKVAQTVHVVWDIDKSLSETAKTEFIKLCKATGMSFFLCK